MAVLQTYRLKSHGFRPPLKHVLWVFAQVQESPSTETEPCLMGRADLLEGDPPCFVHCFMAQTHAYPVYVYIYIIYMYIYTHASFSLSLYMDLFVYLFIYLWNDPPFLSMRHIPRFPASCAVPKWRFPSLWCTCLFAKSDPRTRSAPGGLWVGTLGLSKYCSCSFFFGGGAMESPSVLDGHAHMNFKYVFFPFFPHI